jgi:hypothetical protein
MTAREAVFPFFTGNYVPAPATIADSFPLFRRIAGSKTLATIFMSDGIRRFSYQRAMAEIF